MSRRLVYSLLSLMLVGPLGLSAASPHQASARIAIHVEADVVTVQATRVPQRQLLEALAAQLGFELVVLGRLDTVRSLELYRRPWQEALRLALVPSSWAAVYGTTATGRRPVKVFVFPAAPRTTPTTPLQADALRQRAVQASRPAVQATLRRLEQAQDEATRVQALFDLFAAAGSPEDARFFAEAFAAETDWLVQVALRALVALEGEQALPDLLRALGDARADVRQAARRALRALGYGPRQTDVPSSLDVISR